MIKESTIEFTLGKTFNDSLNTFVIDAGQDLSFTRREMVEIVGCANFNAAARLNKVLKKHKIFSVAKLYWWHPTDLLRIKGIGMTTVFVAMCLMDHKGYDVEVWWGWDQKDNVVKFSSFKEKALKRAKKRAS